MTELQAVEMLAKLDEIIVLLNNTEPGAISILGQLVAISDWLAQITSWVVVHIGVIVPGVLVLGLMYWALSQFINRYY
jgi:formate/nitrite transporter FocA (FNT family)